MLGMVQAMIEAKQPTAGSAKFDVHTEDGAIKLSMMIPEADLLKAIQMQTGVATQAMAGMPPVRTAPVFSRPPAVAVRPAAPAKAASPAMVFDKDGNTVILTLPGARK
jgi:hypothetical protein